MSEPAIVTLEDIRCTQAGMTALGAYAAALARNSGQAIAVDCTLVQWIDANIAAALRALNSQAREAGGAVRFMNLNPRVRNVLARNGFLDNAVAPGKTTVPLKEFELSDAKEFASYTTQQLGAQDIPEMSEGLRKKFFEGIDELFNNASIHSRSRGRVFACGQAYPKKRVLDFSIVDLGVGFRRNVEDYLDEPTTGAEAIQWAMEKENTTRSGDIPGGLGLKILKSFVELNEGRLTVFSDSGYWNLSANGIRMEDLSTRFPGTFVNLEINTADENYYYLDTEIDPNQAL